MRNFDYRGLGARLWLTMAVAGALMSVVFGGGGCASLQKSARGALAADVTAAILNQNDIETAREGIPAYLVMLDGMIEGAPDDPGLLLAGARLYGAYATAFVADEGRRQRLAARAKTYGDRALCMRLPEVCAAREGSLDGFSGALETVTPDGVPVLYGFAGAWAGWVKANADDWDAVAKIPYIEAAMKRVVALDEAQDGGGAHLYLGVLATRLPAELGGKPDEGRTHFERAVVLSEGKNLMAKVLFARHYARLVFDRELHDRLVEEVLEADPGVSGYTLINLLAQEDARELRDGADEFF